MSSMFDELRNFWLRVEVVFAVCTSDAPEMRTACALSWHHLLGLRCMMVRGGLSMYKPDFRWEPQAAGLLARKGGKGGFIPHAAVPLVFSSLLKHHDHLSSHDFLSIFFFFVVLGKEPRASHKLGKCSSTELHPRPSSVHLYSFKAFEGLTV